MASVPVLVFLLGLVVLCASQCDLDEQPVQDVNKPPTGCVDKDGTDYEVGSEWVRDCMDCSCTDDEGLNCCSNLPDEQDLNIPEDCELILDKEDCTAKVVLKSDKTQECSPV